MKSPLSQNHQPARADELDGLRGLLALWVALAHMFSWCGFLEASLPRPFGKVWPVFVEASAAVDAFIILSGFAITFLLHAKRQSWGAFMTGRVFRIYPAYLVCLALSVASTFLTREILDTASWKDATQYFVWLREFANSESTAFASHTFWHLTLLNGILLKSFLPHATATILAPAWSITLEWQYYLVAPLVARLVTTIGGLIGLAGVAFLGAHYGSHWQNPMLAFFPAHLPLFLVGIGSYHLYATWGTGKKSSLVFFACIALLIAAGFIPLGSPGEKISISNALRLAVSLPHQHSIGLGIWALAFGCILAPGPLGLLRKALLHPRLQQLGKVSFPLYLVHWPIIIGILSALLKFAPGISGGKAVTVLIVVGVPMILTASQLLHLFVEKPGMALGRKVVRRERPVIAPETAAES